jgi:hypothetical protein
LNSNSGRFYFIFLLSLFHLKNRVCLSRGVHVAGAAWRAATRIMIGIGDLVQRIGDSRTGRMASCAICIVPVETRNASFLVEPQNQGRRFVSSLASKPATTVFSGLVSKPVTTVFSNLTSKLVATVSPDLASKPVVDFLVEPQN